MSEAINQHKMMAENGNVPGVGSLGMGPTMASTAGQKFNHPSVGEMPDGRRGHPGRHGKSKPSHPADVDHGPIEGKW